MLEDELSKFFHFKAMARGMGYQTMIHEVLRAAMTAERTPSTD